MAPWSIEWLVKAEAGTRSVPALVFLKGQPQAVRNQLLAIIDAVRVGGPDRWFDRQSHKPMKGDLAHLHEARDKHDHMLYRLFVLWQRNERRVVIIDGRAKPNSTTLDDDEYEAIRDLAATVVDDPPPFAAAYDMAREMLNEQDEAA